MGADALKSLINRLDLDIEEEKLKAAIDPEEGQRPLSAQRKQKAIKRLKIVTAFNKRNDAGKRVNDPGAMILDVVPVIPPELRPLVLSAVALPVLGRTEDLLAEEPVLLDRKSTRLNSSH